VAPGHTLLIDQSPRPDGPASGAVLAL